MFSRREKILLALATVAVALVIASRFVGSGTPTATTRSGNTDLRARRQQVAAAQKRLAELTISAEGASAWLLRTAQASAGRTGVTVASVRPRAASKLSSGAIEQALEVQADGRFPNVARFMFDLEAKNANMRIARVAISSSDPTSDKVTCTITVACYGSGAVK